MHIKSDVDFHSISQNFYRPTSFRTSIFVKFNFNKTNSSKSKVYQIFAYSRKCEYFQRFDSKVLELRSEVLRRRKVQTAFKLHTTYLYTILYIPTQHSYDLSSVRISHPKAFIGWVTLFQWYLLTCQIVILKRIIISKTWTEIKKLTKISISMNGCNNFHFLLYHKPTTFVLQTFYLGKYLVYNQRWCSSRDLALTTRQKGQKLKTQCRKFTKRPEAPAQTQQENLTFCFATAS